MECNNSINIQNPVIKKDNKEKENYKPKTIAEFINEDEIEEISDNLSLK